MRTLLLGIDVGTSSAKAALYGPDGALTALASAPLQVQRPGPGQVEQEVAEIWAAAAAATRAALREAAARPEEVRGIAAVGQSPTLILLDRAGQPLRPAMLWQDTRAAAETRELAELLGEDRADILGGELPVTASFMPGRLLWLRRHEPEALARAGTIFEPKDYVHYRLTGVRASDPWSAKGLTNLRTGQLIPAWPEVLGLSAEVVPAIVECHRPIGGVSAEAAAALGLAPGTPVAAGWTDGLASMVGSGVFVGGGLGFLVSGTSEVVGTVVPGLPRGDRRLLETPCPDDRHVVMGSSQCGGGALQWFADRFLGGDVGRALGLAAAAPAGAGGLVFLPYLEGERAPLWDERARGGFFGLATAHGLAELARAVLEGVAASDRHILETVEGSTGRVVERLRVSGGARGGLWGQIRASMLGRPLEATSAQPGTLGAAMLAGVAAGLWPTLDAATRAAVAVTARIDPEPAAQPAYEAVYGTYRALYPRLRDLW